MTGAADDRRPDHPIRRCPAPGRPWSRTGSAALVVLVVGLVGVLVDLLAVAARQGAVAGLLDGGPLAGLLDQLSTLLNQMLGILNR